MRTRRGGEQSRHSVQYLFDWGDGSIRAGYVGKRVPRTVGTPQITTPVKVQARCGHPDTSVVSVWSGSLDGRHHGGGHARAAITIFVATNNAVVTTAPAFRQRTASDSGRGNNGVFLGDG